MKGLALHLNRIVSSCSGDAKFVLNRFYGSEENENGQCLQRRHRHETKDKF